MTPELNIPGHDQYLHHIHHTADAAYLAQILPSDLNNVSIKTRRKYSIKHALSLNSWLNQL